MMSPKDNESANHQRICPKTGKVIGRGRMCWWLKWTLPFVGLVSLVWFLIRVIPKPSRATYPCQRVAVPLASGFVVWIAGLTGSTLAYRKAKRLLGRSRYVLAGFFVVMSVAILWISICATDNNPAKAAPTGVFVPSDPANSPMGIAKGIHPGRVVWSHDPEATSWDGLSNYWWSSQFNNQTVINGLLADVVNTVAGGTSVLDSWDKLFRDLNKRKGKGDVGYKTAEKIALKINLNSGGGSNGNRVDASPQMVCALLDELVNQVGVPQQNITVFDAQRAAINAVSDYCKPKFPNVKYNDWGGWVANMITFSSSEVSGSDVRRLPQAVVQANYFINMALLKRHCQITDSWSDSAGQTAITVCGKNNFGTSGSPSAMHVTIRDWNRGMGRYNAIVDLIGSKYMGGNTVLYIVDGLYAGDRHDAQPQRWRITPFNNDWPSSVFASQDPIAIDSVCLDFLNAEWGLVANADNYLHEASQADNPPSGTIYKPDGVKLSSLGVHEHWNNVAEKKYSRNLGTGNGIELIVPSLTDPNGPIENLTKGTRYDYIHHAIKDADQGDEIVMHTGTYRETLDFGGKNLTVRSQDPNDPEVVAATIIEGDNQTVVFSTGEGPACVLAGLTLTSASTGIYCSGASPTITNCVIIQNEGTGIALRNQSNPTIINCLIAANTGYGIDMTPLRGRTVQYNYATIDHCTIVENTQQGIFESIPTIANSIVFFNGLGAALPQIECYLATVTYSDVQGGSPGTGNIDADPCFVAPGDYHLRWSSPCINAGDPNYTVEPPHADMDGEPRLMAGRTDIGCDEVGDKQADLTHDGKIDSRDLQVFTRAWLCCTGDRYWNILCDLQQDGCIDLIDWTALAGDWLWHADWYKP
jgi:parallel beta-helix repeat protein